MFKNLLIYSKFKFIYVGRKRPGGGGIPVAQTGIPLARDWDEKRPVSI